MSKLINLLLSRLPIVKTLDGYKRYIGFLIWLLGYIAEGLGAAAVYFPENSDGLLGWAKALSQIAGQISETLKSLGLTIMVVGVGHDAAKSLPIKN